MDTVKIDARDVNFWYGDFHALKGISMQIEEKSVVAFIGPSGCGKSTFLRLFNRMNDLIPATRLEGEIRIDGHNIYAKGVEVPSWTPIFLPERSSTEKTVFSACFLPQEVNCKDRPIQKKINSRRNTRQA